MENEAIRKSHGTLAETPAGTLLGALVGLTRAMSGNVHVSEKTWRAFLAGLQAVDGWFADDQTPQEERIEFLISQVHAEKQKLAPDCAVCTSPCGRTADYDMKDLFREPEDEKSREVQALKKEILRRSCAVAGRVFCDIEAGAVDEERKFLLARAVFAIGDDWDVDALHALIGELSKVEDSDS